MTTSDSFHVFKNAFNIFRFSLINKTIRENLQDMKNLQVCNKNNVFHWS